MELPHGTHWQTHPRTAHVSSPSVFTRGSPKMENILGRFYRTIQLLDMLQTGHTAKQPRSVWAIGQFGSLLGAAVDLDGAIRIRREGGRENTGCLQNTLGDGVYGPDDAAHETHSTDVGLSKPQVVKEDDAGLGRGTRDHF